MKTNKRSLIKRLLSDYYATLPDCTSNIIIIIIIIIIYLAFNSSINNIHGLLGEETLRNLQAFWRGHLGNEIYYMPIPVSGQDEPNLALWLATRAGKVDLSCPLGIRALSRKYTDHAFGVLSHIINPLLTKLSRSRWLDIGLVLFLRVYGPRRRKTSKKKNLANI